MKKVRKTLTATILSISLLTVMAGAAIAPALGIIKEHFSDSPAILIQFIISMPALFVIVTNLAFPWLCKLMKTRTMAITGLLLYVICGAVPFVLDNIWAILTFRALLGVSVGMIMPLSTGLLAYYFPPEDQARLMGLSAAMNQMGGVVATMLAGILAGISWNMSFLVYLLGLIAIVMVAFFLPNDRLGKKEDIAENHVNWGESKGTETMGFWVRIKKFHPSIIGMFLCMSLFFVYPSNFALITEAQTTISQMTVTLIMVGLDVIAFFVGLVFGPIMKNFRVSIKYFAPLGFIAGYVILASDIGVATLLLGSALIGLANGVGIPYLNTIASIKGGKDAVTTVMPLISASLYLGQFLSPIYISSLGNAVFRNVAAPYLMAIAFGIVYLIQVFLTQKFQSLPPVKKD